MSMRENASVIKNNACIEDIPYVFYKIFSKQSRIIDSRSHQRVQLYFLNLIVSESAKRK